MDPAEEALRQQLAATGVEHEIVPCDPDLADTAAFCAAYGYALEDSANTILVVGKSNPPRYVACVVLATSRLDVNRTVRRRLGAGRTSFASPEDTQAQTGMMIGGVTVFGLPGHLPIWVDSRVMERERIVLGGGSRSFKVLAPPSILLTLPAVEVVEGLALDNPRPPVETAGPAEETSTSSPQPAEERIDGGER
jgi:prolyl-tRNA editing enzyme YbaK/EbsC (Cys-tRNA(Pro) deacylase)